MARERRSRDEWQRIVTRWRSSEWTAEYFANRNGLSPRTLRWWSSKIPAEDVVNATPTFVPVQVTDLRRTELGSIELEVGHVRIRVELGTDPDYVAALVRSLLEIRVAC